MDAPNLESSSSIAWSLAKALPDTPDWIDIQKPGAAYLLVGGLLYLVGTILVTIVFNVPRNDALAAVDPTSADGASLWAGYVTSWTAWNHVRTAAGFGAAASLTIALCMPHAG